MNLKVLPEAVSLFCHCVFRLIFLIASALMVLACGNEEEPEPQNQPPAFQSARAYNVSENAATIATLLASDPEGDGVNLRISGGPDGALFRLAPGTGSLSFGSAPDFEDPRDDNADNVYEVRVTAEDAEGASVSAMVAVTVLDLAEAPVIQAPSQIEVPEEQAYAYIINASDPEGTALSFSIEGGVDSGLFSIETATGTLRLDHVPDFEQPQDSNADNYHEVIVGARDGDGELATHALTVRVLEVNEAPHFTSSGSINLPENNLAVTTLSASDPEGEPLTFSIDGGEDGGLFALNGETGELAFRQFPDYESPDDVDSDNVYQLQVGVTDYRGASTSLMLNVEVNDKARDIQSSLVFPPPGAHFGGRVEQYALVGRLTDLEDSTITDSEINYIEVDGKRVPPDSDDASRWRTQIGAERRNREILVEVSMADGSLHQSRLTLRNAPFFQTTSVTVDPGRNRALLPGIRGSGQIVGVDLAEYDRMLVGECAGVDQIDFLVLDDPGDQVIVAARSETDVPSLWRVNIASTGCTKFSGGGAGSGPPLGAIAGIELDEDVDTNAGEHERVLVLNGDDDTVMVVDAQTGERTVFAGIGTGSDPAFGGLSAIALDTSSYRALLPATGTESVLYEMDLATAARGVVADNLDMVDSTPVAVNAFRNEAYIVDSTGAIDAINMDDAGLSPLAEVGLPGDPAYLGETGDLELDASSGRLLIASRDDRPTGRLISARTWSGEKTLLTSNAVGDGPRFRGVKDMAVDEVAGKAYVLDQGTESAITAVDLRSGERTRNPLPHFSHVVSLTYDVGRNRLLVLGEPADGDVPHELVEVALPDYSVSVISGFQATTGPAPVSPGPLAFDESNDRVVIADAGLDALLSVDPGTGEHEVLSDNATGTGPALDHVSDLLVDAVRARVVAVETTRGLLGIDMQSGNRIDLLPANMAGEHPDAELDSISLDGGGSTSLIVGVQGTEVQRIDPVADTVQLLTELDMPPGHGMDKIVSMQISPYSELAWLVGDSGRVLVLENNSSQWAVLSR